MILTHANKSQEKSWQLLKRSLFSKWLEHKEMAEENVDWLLEAVIRGQWGAVRSLCIVEWRSLPQASYGSSAVVSGLLCLTLESLQTLYGGPFQPPRPTPQHAMLCLPLHPALVLPLPLPTEVRESLTNDQLLSLCRDTQVFLTSILCCLTTIPSSRPHWK